MSQNSSPKPALWRRLLIIGGLPVWVFLGFMLAQAIIIVLASGLQAIGVPLDSANTTVLNATLMAVVYTLSVVIVVGVPWLVKKRRTTRKELGIQELPVWLDLLWAPVGYVVYAFLAVLAIWAATMFLPFVDIDQVQDTGFALIGERFEYVLAFIALVIIAPIAEEILFRGYLLQKLRRRAPLWIAILITSLTFAIVHFAWNVGIDVFVLSIVLCILRVVTGNLWASIFLHMLKNGIAYYFLFISPVIPGTL